MHSKESKVQRTRASSKSISPGKTIGQYPDGRPAQSDHADFRRSTKRKHQPPADPFPHVSGIKQELSLIQIYSRVDSNVNNSVLGRMIELLTHHPDFTDRDWNSNSGIDEFVHFIQDQFSELYCKEHPVYIDFPEQEEPVLYWIYALDECESYGNIIPFEWLKLLKVKDKSFLELTYHFLSICHHKLHIPAWNDYNCSCYLDDLACRIEDEDDQEDLREEYDIEDLESLKENFAEWDDATSIYHQAIKRSHSLVRFKRLLKKYKPRNRNFKKVAAWYEKAIILISRGIDFYQFENSPVTDHGNPYRTNNYYQNGEAWPSRYCGFTWSFDGYIGHTLSSELDEIAGNCGVIPLIESQEITPEIKQPRFGKAKEFYDWMSEGNEACRKLFQNLTK
ncbi:MAG: hypothetical protein RLO12_03620 [Fulvivirga sp.]